MNIVFNAGAGRPASILGAGARGNGPDSPRESEPHFLQRLLADDPRAWVEFQSKYRRVLFACITNVMRRRGTYSYDSDDIGEIYSSFLASLFANDKAKLKHFDPARGVRLSTWLGMLAIRATYDYLRAVRREPRTDNVSSADAIVASDDPHAHVERCERQRIAREIFSAFSPRDQLFARLYFVEELPVDEIARRMEINVKTVYSKRHKIQQRLQTLVEQVAA